MSIIMETKNHKNFHSNLLNSRNSQFIKGKNFFYLLVFICLAPLAVFTYSTQSLYYENSYQPISDFTGSCQTNESKGGCSDDVYDLRIIILTFNRPQSLLILLESLNSLELDGDKAVVEIMIDVPQKGFVHEDTLQVAKSFRWSKGDLKVTVQEKHMGLIGQWINSWRPKNKTRVVGDEMDYEICLILEDDLVVSKWAYRWLRAARNKFRKQREIMGITLQSADLINAATGGSFKYPKITGPSFLYKTVSSWGLAPDAEHWTAFQSWYDEYHESTKPYVPNTVMLKWYHEFENLKKTDTMWTMWLLYFTYKLNLFTLFPNIPRYPGFARRSRTCLVYNRKEPGLHYVKSKFRIKYPCLYFDWKDFYVKFSDQQVYVAYNGEVISPPVFNFTQNFNYTIV